MSTPSSALERMPNGAAAAAILAAGIGSSAYALLVFLSEMSGAVGSALNFYDPTGPLSGKTTVAVLVWLVVWFVLHRRWRNKDVDFARVFRLSLVLIALAFLGTFPPVFTLFGD